MARLSASLATCTCQGPGAVWPKKEWRRPVSKDCPWSARQSTDSDRSSDVSRPGDSSQVRPSSSRPPALGVRPPHCLKKNGTPASAHWSRMLARPGRVHRPAFGPGLAAGDDPVDAVQVQVGAAARAAARTTGTAPRRDLRAGRRCGRRALARLRPTRPSTRSAASRQLVGAAGAAGAPAWSAPDRCAAGCAAMTSNTSRTNVDRHLGVEQVAHRVDEHDPRAAPASAADASASGWSVTPNPGRRSAGRRRVWYFAAPIALSRLDKRQRVAVVAPGRDSVAAGGGVPGRLGPLDARLVTHLDHPCRHGNAGW